MTPQITCSNVSGAKTQKKRNGKQTLFEKTFRFADALNKKYPVNIIGCGIFDEQQVDNPENNIKQFFAVFNYILKQAANGARKEGGLDKERYNMFIAAAQNSIEIDVKEKSFFCAIKTRRIVDYNENVANKKFYDLLEKNEDKKFLEFYLNFKKNIEVFNSEYRNKTNEVGLLKENPTVESLQPMHVIRYARECLRSIISDIIGYGLTKK